ncbi:Putative transposase (identified by ISEscan HMM) [Klebsiella quasipneumoniae]|nr:Putative transposase (identified by ISEscan HMM) [Klebsiella quasipneumoniae]
MKKRNFSAEFKRESAQLVVDQNYTVADAASAMDVGLSTMTRWVKQLRDERQGKTPKASPITPEQIEIRELRKKLQRIEMENEILKGYRALDVRLPEQFSIIGKLRARYPVATLCHVFGVHRSSYKYWKTVLKSQTADGLYYAVRYLNCMASATALPEQEASPQWQPREVTRWGAGLLADS